VAACVAVSASAQPARGPTAGTGAGDPGRKRWLLRALSDDEGESLLFKGLPNRDPEGQALTGVAFLGVFPPAGPVALAKHWLLPQRPDYVGFGEVALEEAGARFPLAALGDLSATDLTELDALHNDPSPEGAAAALCEKLGFAGVLWVEVETPWLFWEPPQARSVLVLASGGGSALHERRIALPSTEVAWSIPWGSAAMLAMGLLWLIASLRGGGRLEIEVTGSESPGVAIAYTAYVSRERIAGDSTKGALSRAVAAGRVSFPGLAARTWYVGVRRVERDPKSLEVRKNTLQQRSVTLASGAVERMKFEFTAQVPVNLTLSEGKAAPGAHVLVGVRELRDAARYVKGAASALPLPPGSYTLAFGYKDRAFELPLTVDAAAKEASLAVDLASSQHEVFRGCAKAVQPFVHGDLATAANLLESAGQPERAASLRARVHKAKGQLREAAELLEAAGEVKDAAELRASAGDTSAAALFERTGDWAKAAALHSKAGRHAAAARALAKAGDFDGALAAAHQSGDRTLLSELLTQRGFYTEAARLALEDDDVSGAIRLLQKVPLSHASYGDASLLLAELFLKQGEPELALGKLDEAVQHHGEDTWLELREQIAEQLEGKGEIQKAIEAWETIRKRDVSYSGSAEKLEALRGRLRGATRVAPAGGGAAPAASAPTEIAERYELLQEVGRGGMGVVFKARDRMLGRIVALKKLPENLKEHPTAVQLFLREARSVAALSHENIVTLFDAGQDGTGAYYLTMEFLEGKPLNALLGSRKRFSVPDAARLGLEVAEGLAYAHGQRIIHRDIKPANLFLTARRRVKIMDFGLAKAVEEVRKAASVIGGTPHYMAPEQARGGAVDHRVDLYAFGVTLFQFVTGSVPFDDGDVIYHHGHTPPPDPRTLNDQIPDALAGLLLELMAKKPEDRPADAVAVKRRLSSFVTR
jgi:tRNA A-37 threonylcarbamoyl transferase component Bud32